jgi:monothiol glutaredoxin
MIQQRTAGDVAAALQTGRLRVIDVRQPWEIAVVSVAGAESLDEALVDELRTLDRDTPLAFLCHHGVRSQHAAMHFEGLGFTHLVNVVGGIDAWALDVNPSMARY